jgi:hypothetical protein
VTPYLISWTKIVARIINPTNGVVVSPLFIEERHLFALDKVLTILSKKEKAKKVTLKRKI